MVASYLAEGAIGRLSDISSPIRISLNYLEMPGSGSADLLLRYGEVPVALPADGEAGAGSDSGYCRGPWPRRYTPRLSDSH